MRTLSTIIFWIAILLLILWIGIPFIADISGLILTDKRLSEFYHNSRYIVVPVAFLATLFKTLKKGSAWYIEMRTIFLTAGAAIFSILVFLSGFFDGLCGSTTKSTLYINQQISSSKIFFREYECGAASAGPQPEIVRVDTVYKIFIRVTKIDTTKLDTAIWIRQ